MVRIVLLFLMSFIGFSTLSQYNVKEGFKSSTFRPGVMWFYTGLYPAKANKPSKYDRLIFDVTYNDWIGDENLFQNSWASIGLNTNLMFDIPLINRNIISLGIGISHQYTNIRHDNRFYRDYFYNTSVYMTDNLSSWQYNRKNTLSSNSFSIPIELRFRKESWRHIKFHLGGKIGYQINLFSKRTYKVNGNKEVYKRYDFPDENKLVYSAHVRLGLRNWALYASYNFNTIFSNNYSTELNLVQMGISVSLF